MKLTELLTLYKDKVLQTVPNWMIGCFQRKNITFANGLSDSYTQVFWLQGRNITIDLRLPIKTDLVTTVSLADCTTEELVRLADYEGWSAESIWQQDRLSWSGGVSFQLHNRWPEPAILTRAGDCMIEFSPSSSYIEDWRIQSKTPGPLISLRLIDEINLTNNELRHQGGALIITGNWAGLVLGRKNTLHSASSENQLREELERKSDNKLFLENVFNFEASIAVGNIDTGFIVQHSTCINRVDQHLIELDGFALDEEKKEITQTFTDGSATIKRRFTIDTIESDFIFSAETAWSKESKKWFENEKHTLERYLNKSNK